MNFHPLQELESLFDRLNELKDRLEKDLRPLLDAAGLVHYLRASEYQLILAMMHRAPNNANQSIWQNTAPVSGEGNALFGLIPYWLHSPHSAPAIGNYLTGTDDKLKGFQTLWAILQEAVPTQIDDEKYQALTAAIGDDGLVAADGSIISFHQYEDLDPRWVVALLSYIQTILEDKPPQFDNQSPPQIELAEEDSTNPVTIALLGDWGTGLYGDNPAPKVMALIGGPPLTCDFIVHLGDVYYAGLPDQEDGNYLELWPKDAVGKSFMLNSNHEMYADAQGYIKALTNPIFAAQKSSNYFLLRYHDYSLLCLDTAAYDKSAMFMNGSLGAPDSAQVQWIKSLNLTPGKTIVLTHHNGLHYDGTPLSGNANLWTEVLDALGGPPAAWYWGHVHNGIVYNQSSGAGTQTLARCVGHGAFPFGDAWGLGEQKKPLWTYYARTPNPEWEKHVYNGYAQLTITKDGQVTEKFFEQDGTCPYNQTYQLG